MFFFLPPFYLDSTMNLLMTRWRLPLFADIVHELRKTICYTYVSIIK